MIRIMLVDDHAMLREGLLSKFAACEDIEVVGECSTGTELLNALKETLPDVLLLDIKLPDAHGVNLMKQIRQTVPDCKCVILTMYDHVRYAIHALEAGADGYVVKGEPFVELLQAIRTVRKGGTYVSAGMAPKLVGRLRKGGKPASLDALSQREFEVLTMLSGGMSSKEIARQLNLSEKSVTTYRSRMMEKLNLDNNADLVRFALESGLVV